MKITGSIRVGMLMMAALACTTPAHAQPGSPVYTTSVSDCVTGDNEFRFGGERYWTVDPSCDIYQIDVYERPTAQTYELRGTRFAASEYFAYVDIARARVGWDNRFLFVSIELVGRDNRTSGGDNIPVGMMGRYGFRFSNDPDGRFGYLLVSDQPEVKNKPNTVWGPLGTFGYQDTNGDVGGAAQSGPTGLDVTNSDNPLEESGLNGFDAAVISDGVYAGSTPVLWVRLSPSSNRTVEMALDYVALGMTRADVEGLRYFDVEALRGAPGDPQSSLWNDTYANTEAGSPNPGPNGSSEFGTQGLGNISECDTVRIGALTTPPPPPACRADFDGNGVLSSADFFAFVTAFFAGDPRADLNADGVIGSADLFEFMTLFFAGCP